jgi:cytochrome c-type biogenesis protein CcmH/NrfG
MLIHRLKKPMATVGLLFCVAPIYLIPLFIGHDDQPSKPLAVDMVKQAVLLLEKEIATKSALLADAYLAKQDYRNALVHYQKASALEPLNSAHQRNIERLQHYTESKK